MHVNEVFTQYHNAVLKIIDKHAPYKILTNNEIKWRNKPWIGKHIQAKIREKDKLYSKFVKTKDPFWYNRYKYVRNDINLKTKEAKSKFYTKYFEQNMKNSMKIWKGINELTSNSGFRAESEIHLEGTDKTSNAKNNVANQFNSFYTNIASKLVSKLGKRNNKYQDYLKNPNKHSIYLTETEPGEVSDILRNLDISKAGDIYGITPRLLKIASFEFSENLSKIFNKCIATGTFPDLLKVAKVIPIHKGESTMDVSNYRPISLLPIIGKVFERIIYRRLYLFITRHRILYPKQYGFQKGKSTEQALIDIQSKILDALENNETPCCVLLDFAKAFDTVNHSILLGKLYHYGIRGLPHDLISSYLNNRTQYVSANGQLSNVGQISYGVPQGSILGPLLFLVYINDISESSKLLSFYLFADDTTLFMSHRNRKHLEETFNTELCKISNWLIANQLSLNVDKTHLLTFRSKPNVKFENIVLKIDNSIIEEKEEAKYLGVILDNQLTFKSHINKVYNKLIKGNAILAKTRCFIPSKIRRCMFFSHIQSHVNYGLAVWGYSHKTHTEKVKSQMKKSIKKISHNNICSRNTSMLFSEAKI